MPSHACQKCVTKEARLPETALDFQHIAFSTASHMYKKKYSLVDTICLCGLPLQQAKCSFQSPRFLWIYFPEHVLNLISKFFSSVQFWIYRAQVDSALSWYLPTTCLRLTSHWIFCILINFKENFGGQISDFQYIMHSRSGIWQIVQSLPPSA